MHVMKDGHSKMATPSFFEPARSLLLFLSSFSKFPGEEACDRLVCVWPSPGSVALVRRVGSCCSWDPSVSEMAQTSDKGDDMGWQMTSQSVE